MKKRIAVFVGVIVLELLQLSRWLSSCVGFKDELHMYTAQINEYLTRDIHNEQQVPILVVRIFYNKVTETIFWTLKPYLRFYDVQFLVSLLTCVGFVGILLGVWFLVTKKHKPFVYILPVVLFMLPLLEVFIHPKTLYPLWLFVIALPFQLLSLYGIGMLLKKKKTMLPIMIISLCILVSMLFLIVYPTDLYAYCIAR